ncbi:prephenate dehydratase [Kangiella sp. TOML190]|uniref:prephenate dehydratase n=1 Tax=Kangiella sp. TOML190 TaxID=2931351 RepID=UPI00203CF278|nr:prephenate dehydratase [Kangiella sp. TOML190]
MSNDELKTLRTAINQLDKELLQVFAKRRQLSKQVAQTKYQKQLNIRDQAQEKKLLSQLLSNADKLGLDSATTLSLFHNIIEDSIRTQYDYFLSQEHSAEQPITLALLGSDTSYSAIAAKNHFATKSSDYKPRYFKNFKQIFDSLKTDKCNHALVPIENTNSGNITDIHDLLLEYDVKIVGEEKLKVKHCLIGIASASLDQITDVYSHPQAISQCKSFLDEHSKITSHFRSSTSAAIKLVDEYQNPSIAAIASEEAAVESGLSILQAGINNYQENYTRFLLVSRKEIQVPAKIPAKTSIVLTTKQQAGSLADCLLILKNHQINMTKIESRPISSKPWQEMFYIDFEGNTEDMDIEKMLYELERTAHQIKVLGCYPQHDILATHLDAKTLSDIEHNAT